MELENKKTGFKAENLKIEKTQTRVYHLLEREISNGAFPDGKLPSEPKLAQMLGVSRATISVTLAFMEREGIVVRRHGSATYVNKAYADIKAQITDGVGIYDLISKCGYNPSLIWNQSEEVNQKELSAYITRKLSLKEGSKVIRICRLFGADEQPAVYVEEYIPCDNLNKPFNMEALPETLYKLVDEYCKRTIEFTIVDIVPCTPEDKITKYFSFDDNKGILLSEELHLDNQSNPLVFSKVYTYDKYIRYQAVRIRK